MMMFHTVFVLMTVLGWQIHWTTQNRADTSLGMAHCLKLYGWLTALGLITQGVVSYYLGSSGFWLTPIFLGWTLAPFLAWITSSKRIGLLLKSARLFLTPDECEPPPELKDLDTAGEEEGAVGPLLWTHALLCPYVQAVHLSLVRQGSTSTPETPTALIEVRERLIREGPQSINPKEKVRLLWNGDSVFWLHQELWGRPATQMHPSWIKLQAESSRSRLIDDYLRAN